VSEATAQAAGRVRGIELGERRLHWLKNVTEPVAARLASRHQPAPARRRRCSLRNLLPKRPELTLP
jgi:hypothetical protein